MASVEIPKEVPIVVPDAAAPAAETVADSEELKAKALKQVEFYFADSNLPFDRFMWTLHTSNEQHWVPISTVASFKRMRPYQSQGIPWLADVLRKSKSLLEVDETGTKVRRVGEVQEPKDQFERSVYAKGFGDETDTLQDELEEFFAQWGPVSAVRMRRMDGSKKFKGSVFCEFTEFDSVKKFLEADPEPKWKDSELLIMSKEAYCDMKIKEKGLSGKAAELTKGNASARRGFNAFKEEKGGKGKKPSEDEEKPEIYLEFLGVRLKVNQENGGSVDENEIPFIKGASLKFIGCGGDVKYTEVKAPLKDRFERAPFIKFERGSDWGLLGFDKPLSEEDITFVKDTLKTVNGNSVTWEVPDEETEKAFQAERAQTAAQRVVANDVGGNSSSGRGGRGRSRGGRGGRGSRGGGRGGGGRGGDRNGPKSSEEAKAGEKRQRAVEPDGGPNTKGQGVPVIQSAKKVKTDAKS